MRRAMIAFMFLTTPASAQPRTGDAAGGQRLTEQWCANCHQVAPGGPGPATDAVPSFATIARRPGRTLDWLSTLLRVPHSTMPDHGLTLEQARDLAAYILSQPL
jgi:mono/diheme cytochrome c family protein